MAEAEYTETDRLDGTPARSDRIERRGLMAALDASQSLVWFDASGSVVDANENALQMFGYSELEMMKQDFCVLCGSSNNGRSGSSGSLASRREWNRIATGETVHNERSFVTSDGAEIWASVSFAAIKNENGVTRRVVAIFIDIGKFAWKPNDLRWAR